MTLPSATHSSSAVSATRLADQAAQGADDTIRATQRVANDALDRLSDKVHETHDRAVPHVARLAERAEDLVHRGSAALRESRDIAYTTVMTMMNILEVKGYLKKEKTERAYRYRPARPERVVISGMVREFVNRVFDGASRPLLLHLVKESRLTEKERDELLRLIKESE